MCCCFLLLLLLSFECISKRAHSQKLAWTIKAASDLSEGVCHTPSELLHSSMFNALCALFVERAKLCVAGKWVRKSELNIGSDTTLGVG